MLYWEKNFGGSRKALKGKKIMFRSFGQVGGGDGVLDWNTEENKYELLLSLVKIIIVIRQGKVSY